ncbi:three-helix bundle dimerization domain-containing protein [Rhodococcus opacus]|uniref:three-helix bundle dimerization domain-containing protein n=1 Tax=Rhodococcus opacus TaxID=37919 RepID=UPI000A848A3C
MEKIAHSAHAHFANRKVRDFVPLLVERNAREKIRGLGSGGSPRSDCRPVKLSGQVVEPPVLQRPTTRGERVLAAGTSIADQAAADPGHFRHHRRG